VEGRTGESDDCVALTVIPSGGRRPESRNPWLAGRFYIDVGTLEDVAWEFPFPQYATPTVLLANRHLRDVLQAKGYWVRYREINGPHDPLSWRGTFGDALITLIGR
jgi:hypothetical protein